MASKDAFPADIAPWLLKYVAEQAQPDQLEAWVNRVTAALFDEVSDIRIIDGLEDRVQDAVREHWLAFLSDLVQPRQHFHLVEEAGRLAGLLAELQIPLETLVRLYRIAQLEVWNYVSDLIGSLTSAEFDRADLLVYFWDRAGVWLDKSVSTSIDLYQEARGRVLAGAAAQRFESVKAVLDGQLTDAREASRALGGYPFSAHHTAFAVSVGDAEQAGALEPLATDLLRAAGSAHPLVVKPGGRQLWLWVATQGVLDLSRLEGLPSGPGEASVGIGTSIPGIGGFVASHREAQGALEVAVPGAAAWLSRYDAVELPVLLGCSPAVDRFVMRQLGPLAREDESMCRIRETLIAFLASGGSAEEASRLLVVHRNTVRYRIAQAEELLNRPIAKISPALSVALDHHSLYHRV